jgi:hypothetical protein
MRVLLCFACAKYLGHLPEGFVEFHILINAFDCPALGHAPTMQAAARVVALTATNDVFLNRIQRGPKIHSIVSVASGIEEHRGLDWGLTWIFPAVSCRASGQRKPFGSQDSILEELYLFHDVGHSTKDFKRSLDDRIGIEPGMFDRYPLERGIGDDQAVRADQSKQTAVKLVSAALVVTVQKHDLRPDLVLFPSLGVFRSCETDEMFLESASCLGANALLFGTDKSFE